MKPKNPKPLTHAEFSARGGKANTPAQNAARAANSRKAANDKKLHKSDEAKATMYGSLIFTRKEAFVIPIKKQDETK